MLNLIQVQQLAMEGKLIGLFDVEEAAYHEGPGFSQSLLKQFKLSPAHAKAYLSESNQPTKAMQIGSAFHCATLEPVRFESGFCVAPKLDRRTNAGKEAYLAWEAENLGKVILSNDDMELITSMRDAVKSHDIYGALQTATVEKAAYWIDQTTGLLCKCKADAILWDKGRIVDLKTTSDDATIKGFSRTVGQYDYHLQAAWYLDGIEQATLQAKDDETGKKYVFNWPKEFVFVVVEKSSPHGVGLFNIHEYDMCVGREMYRRYLQELSVCLSENYWPGYEKSVQTVQVPKWA